MPKPWERSEEQGAYLDALLPTFAQARLDHRVPRFKNNLYEGWFERWPEEAVIFGQGWKKGDSMSLDDVHCLGTAIEKRKEQLYNYIRWHASGKVVRSRVSSGILKKFFNKKKATGKRSRKNHKLELYSQKYYDTRFKNQVDQEISETTPANESKKEYKKRQMFIYRKWRSLCWETESDEVKAEIEELWSKMNTAADDASDDDDKDAEGELDQEDPDTGGYGGCLDELGDVMTSFLRELEDQTGWAFTVLAGGLNRKGQVKVVASHIGKTSTGSTFPEVCNNYKENVLREFFSFVKVQHPIEERLLLAQANGEVNNETPSPDKDMSRTNAGDNQDEPPLGVTAVDTSTKRGTTKVGKEAQNSEHGDIASGVTVMPAPSLFPIDILSNDAQADPTRLSFIDAHINAPAPDPDQSLALPPLGFAVSAARFEYPTASMPASASQGLLFPGLDWMPDNPPPLPTPVVQSSPYGNLSPMSSFLAIHSNDGSIMSTNSPSPHAFLDSTNTAAAATLYQTVVDLSQLPNNAYFGQNPPRPAGGLSQASFIPTIVPATNKAASQPGELENRAPELGISNQELVKSRKHSRKDEVDTSFVLPEGATRAHKPRQMADNTHWEGASLKRSRLR